MNWSQERSRSGMKESGRRKDEACVSDKPRSKSLRSGARMMAYSGLSWFQRRRKELAPLMAVFGSDFE